MSYSKKAVCVLMVLVMIFSSIKFPIVVIADQKPNKNSITKYEEKNPRSGKFCMRLLVKELNMKKYLEKMMELMKL